MQNIIPVIMLLSTLSFLINESARSAEAKMITDKGLTRNEIQPALIFTAPPRNVPKDLETYTPIIDFLSNTLNLDIEYRIPTGWGDYNKAMIEDIPDIVFDGPHFNSWRLNHTGHRVIVRLPQIQVWKIVVQTNSPYHGMRVLQGKKACLQGATNFGKLNYMSFFPNTMRLPDVLQIKSRHDGYNDVVAGRCAATIVTSTELSKYNGIYRTEQNAEIPPVRVLKSLKPSPNQAISLSHRIVPRLQNRIKEALLSPQGQEAMSVLRDRYAKNALMIAADEKDYQHVQKVLAGSYPFDNPFDKPLAQAYAAR